MIPNEEQEVEPVEKEIIFEDDMRFLSTEDFTKQGKKYAEFMLNIAKE